MYICQHITCIFHCVTFHYNYITLHWKAGIALNCMTLHCIAVLQWQCNAWYCVVLHDIALVCNAVAVQGIERCQQGEGDLCMPGIALCCVPSIVKYCQVLPSIASKYCQVWHGIALQCLVLQWQSEPLKGCQQGEGESLNICLHWIALLNMVIQYMALQAVAW